METAKVNLSVVGDGKTPNAIKPPVDESTLVHKQLVRGPFWQKIPAWANVSQAECLDHKWQAKLRGRHRYRRGREVPPQGQCRALAEDLHVHLVAQRARGHRHLRR